VHHVLEPEFLTLNLFRHSNLNDVKRQDLLYFISCYLGLCKVFEKVYRSEGFYIWDEFSKPDIDEVFVMMVGDKQFCGGLF
jgi:hypothetical protein